MGLWLLSLVALPAVAAGPQASWRISNAMTLQGIPLVLEQTSFEELEPVLGAARRQHNGGDAAGSLAFICYAAGDGTRLFLLANEMAGPSINGFQLLARGERLSEQDFTGESPQMASDPTCQPSRTLSSGQRVGEGLRLGMKRSEVEAQLGIPEKVQDGASVYSREREVREVIHTDGGIHVSEPWDLAETLVLRFRGDRLVSISALRVSST